MRAAIEDDLRDHAWFAELVEAMLDGLEAYLARWAAFADFLGEPAA
jgi:hypothetical protein